MAEPPFLLWTPMLSWWPTDPPMGMSPCSPVDSELVPLPMCGLGWGGTHLGVRILLGGPQDQPCLPCIKRVVFLDGDCVPVLLFQS